MSNKRNLKLGILVPLLLITAVYFSVPLISKYLIKSKLPDNVQLLEWDMKLLSFNKLCIKHARLKIGLETIENEISVQNACINYFSKNIDIEKIFTKTQERKINLGAIKKPELFPISIPPIFLPKIDLSSIKQLSKIGKLKIDSFKSHYSKKDDTEISLLTSNVELGLEPNNDSSEQIARFRFKNITVNKKQEEKTIQKMFEGQLNITAGTKIIELLLTDSNNTNIVNLELNQTQSQRSLELILASDFVTSQIGDLMPEIVRDYSLKESISLEIIHDLALEQQNINLISKFHQDNQFDNDPKFDNNAKAEAIIFKMNLLAKNQPETKEIALRLTMELAGKELLFEQSGINESTEIKFDKLNSVTNINLRTSSKQLESIDNLSSVINVEKLNFAKNTLAGVKGETNFNSHFNKLKISFNSTNNSNTSNTSNIQVPVKSFESLIKNLSVQGKITAEQFGSKIISNDLKLEIGKTDFEDEPTINLNFKLTKQDNLYHSSGIIQISDFLSDTVIIDNVKSQKKKSENIKSTLKGSLAWDNLSVTLNINTDIIRPIIHSSNIETHIEGADLITSKLDLSDFTFHSKASINDNKLIANGDFDISERRLASIQLTKRDIFTKDNPYSLVVNNPKIQNELISQLATSLVSKIDSKNEVSLSISQGTIEHNNQVKIGDKLNLKSDLELSQFDIDVNNIFLIGLNYKQSINSLAPLNLSAELDVREVTFASGLLLSNISTSVNVNENYSKSRSEESKAKGNVLPNISVSNLKANIWNGKIHSKLIVIENGSLKASTIDLKNIDLTELIFFLNMKGLYADGDIDIHIPISQQGKKYIVEKGHFSSNQTGIIKYDSGQEQADVEANIALHALQDFHYKKLDGTIDYNEAGVYEIKLHLLGSNPSLYDGYPIDFVLSLNGELSDVFQSVFLTGDFEKSILERAKMKQFSR